MKRIILMALAGLTLSSGVALADRHHGGGNNRRGVHQERHEVHRDVRADSRRYNGGGRVVVRNRPAFRNNTWYFSGGVTRSYHRPAIRYHYRSYSSRPAVIVENYDPMPGYIWMAGDWNWNGVEWIWAPGHYEVDANYGY